MLMDEIEILEAIRKFELELAPAFKELRGPEEDAFFLGPALLEEISVLDDPKGAAVWYEEEKMLTVNSVGKKLLEAANGKTTLNNIIKQLDMEETASDAALFYVYLGMMGYMKNHIEIRIFEKIENKEKDRV